MSIQPDLIRLAQEVDLRDIKEYLTSREWKIEPTSRGKLLRIEPPPTAGGEGVFAVIPTSRDFDDYPIRVSELARLVGDIENRPGADVLRDMARRSRADTTPAPQDGPFQRSAE